MLALYGCAQVSPLMFYDRMYRRFKKEGGAVMEMYVPTKGPISDKDIQKRYKSCSVLLFNCFQEFRSAMRAIDKLHLVAVVFDTPLFLAEIKGLKLLDVQKQHQLSYKFRFQPIDYDKVKNEIDGLVIHAHGIHNEPTRAKISLEHIDLLPQLIREQKVGSLTTVFNPIFYSLSHTARNSFMRSTVDFLFGKTTKKQYVQACAKAVPQKGHISDLLKTLLEFMSGEYGTKFLEAFRFINDKRNKKLLENKLDKKGKLKKASIQYSKVAEKFGVDSYELIYFNRMKRQLESVSSYKIENYAAKLRAQKKTTGSLSGKAAAREDASGELA